MLPPPTQVLTVGHARVRGGGGNARRMLETALAPIDPARLGVPRRAVLIIRRLAASAPLGRRSFTPAVEAALRGGLANAARPGRDGVVGQPDAMLFADEAELAAWLIGGRVRNDPPATRWWWPTVLQGRPHAAWWRAEVLPRGDLLPRVIDSLARGGLAATWLSQLEIREIDLALEAIVQAHAVQVVAPTRSRLASSPHRRDPGSKRSAPLATLRLTAPEAFAAQLPEPARRLLAVALVIRRDPGWARGPELAEALGAMALSPRPDGGNLDDPAGVIAEPAALAPPWRKSIRPPSLARQAGPTRTAEPAVENPANPAEPRGLRTGAPTKHPKPGAAVETRSDAGSRGAAAPPDVAPRIDVSDIAAYDLAEPSSAPRRWTTAFGGLFYLLNALLALELYSDFTQPRGRNLPLSPWNLLAMLGARWFDEAFATDAVGPLLADLAGRDPRRRPDAGFVAPDPWITPRDWLAPWPSPAMIGGWAGRRRLMLWHPAGFVIADRRRRPGRSASRQLASLARRAGLPASIIITPLRHAPTRLSRGSARWLDLLALYLRARLAKAIEIDPADAVDLVCRHRATVEAGEGLLDIRLSLDDLPLSLRMAGLDRDPGWIPATGLRPTFHFT